MGSPAESRSTPTELLDVAVALATGGGALVAARVGEARATTVSAKSTPTDLVTDVDRATEEWLLARLREWRPGDAVLGEEGGATEGDTGVRWLLDPIDGTVNFVLGLPDYAVSVAAEVDGEVVAGAVFAPATGALYRASLGGGAHLRAPGQADVRLHGPRDVPLARAVVGTGFGYDPARRSAQAAVVARLIDRIADIRRIGAASLDLCAVAAGRLDGYYEVGLNPWDWGAGLLVAREAGAVATGLRGRDPDGRMTAVAGASFAADLFALLEDLDADAVS
ncbi:inositol monophosphatase family protein [Jatrophihabitans sp. YIM 134969]